MGITQVFRLGKHPEKDSDTVPPVVMEFTTTDMLETILNSARGEGMGKFFKQHIPEAYTKVYSNYIQIGIHMKETKQLNYRLRFEEHSLQLQVKEPSADQYRIIKLFPPKPVKNSKIEVQTLDDEDLIKPCEEDATNITIFLGEVKLEGGINQKSPRRNTRRYEP